MAITITGSLAGATDTLIAGYNPNYIEFTTNLAGTPVKAEITIGTNLVPSFILDITPSTANVFRFDFQGVFRDVANQADNYLETTYSFPNISTLANSLFTDTNISTLVNYSLKILDSTGATIDSTSTLEFYFLKASRQVLEDTVMNEFNYATAQAIHLAPNNKFAVWSGFPIDIQFDAKDSTFQKITLENAVGGTSGAISVLLNTTTEDRMLRLCLIDDLGNEFTGLPDFRIIDIDTSTLVTKTPNFDYIIPANPECAKYIRFKNIEGGDSYWLFTDANQIEVNRKNNKSINRNFTQLESARSRKVSLGNDNSQVLVLHQDTTEQYENDILFALINSPVIELWQGGNKWQRINLINDPAEENSKHTATSFDFFFDLGVKYNQKL